MRVVKKSTRTPNASIGHARSQLTTSVREVLKCVLAGLDDGAGAIRARDHQSTIFLLSLELWFSAGANPGVRKD